MRIAMEQDLTHKQERFAQLVAEGKTYADAYRGAYTVGEKTKNNSIYVKSSRLMDEAKIKLRVDEIRKEIIYRNQATVDEVLNKMAIWLRFNLKSIIKPDGTIKSFEEMTAEEAACIASFEIVELFEGKDDKRTMVGTLKKIRLIDKRAVADQFLKVFGAYITKLSIDKDDLSHLQEIINQIKN